MSTQHRIFKTKFSSVYPLYVQKAEKKGRTRGEVDQVISWLTGYGHEELLRQIALGVDFETFFAEAPAIHPNVSLITGVVCGVRVEEVGDPLTKKNLSVELTEDPTRGSGYTPAGSGRDPHVARRTQRAAVMQSPSGSGAGCSGAKR